MANGTSPGNILAAVVTVMVAILLIVALLVGGSFGCKAYNRYQARQDANNKVKTNHIRIRYFNQQKNIERIKADIRVIHAEGIRRAQDKIAATLTPLYVSFEQTEALKAIAASGSNNSVVFVPTSPTTGLPIVPGLTERVGAAPAAGR